MVETVAKRGKSSGTVGCSGRGAGRSDWEAPYSTGRRGGVPRCFWAASGQGDFRPGETQCCLPDSALWDRLLSRRIAGIFDIAAIAADWHHALGDTMRRPNLIIAAIRISSSLVGLLTTPRLGPSDSRTRRR